MIAEMFGCRCATTPQPRPPLTPLFPGPSAARASLAQTLAALSGYYELSLFNSRSLNAPDNDKAPRRLTASLLTLLPLISFRLPSAPLSSPLCAYCMTLKDNLTTSRAAT